VTLIQRLLSRINYERRSGVKRWLAHGVFLGLIVGISAQGRLIQGVDHTSLLSSLVAGEELVEGPLDPTAYAQTDAPGVGGVRLAAVEGAANIDLITFADPEVDFAGTLGGTAVIAPLSPIPLDPSDEENVPVASVQQSKVYTVEEGDTIAGIASKFNISTNTILWANGLDDSEVIKAGDHITILPVSGVLHTVKSGDTISEVAAQYDVTAKDITEYNKLADSGKLSIGQKLIVPGGAVPQRVAPQIVSGNTRIASREPDGPTPDPVEASGAGFVWPTTTRHISQYFRWGHTGIDIDNRSRPAIYAAAGGTVEFAGWLGGYGNLIIMNHGNGLQTYYGHNDAFYVSQGQTVAKGAAIAKMGSTGRSTGPHLHFEVRKNGRPINPMGMF
jgi:LysM repeat protein